MHKKSEFTLGEMDDIAAFQFDLRVLFNQIVIQAGSIGAPVILKVILPVFIGNGGMQAGNDFFGDDDIIVGSPTDTDGSFIYGQRNRILRNEVLHIDEFGLDIGTDFRKHIVPVPSEGQVAGFPPAIFKYYQEKNKDGEDNGN